MAEMLRGAKEEQEPDLRRRAGQKPMIFSGIRSMVKQDPGCMRRGSHRGRKAIAGSRKVRVDRFPVAANGMATILGVHAPAKSPQVLLEMVLAMKAELTPRDIGLSLHVNRFPRPFGRLQTVN